MTVNLIAMHLQLGVVFVTLFQTAITDKCVTPNNEEGECVSIYCCKILFDALKTKQSEAIEFVRKSICKGRESRRMVCCGSTSTFLAPMINISGKNKLLPARTCVTPNNEVGECVSIYSCKILIDALKTKQSKAIEFVRQSICEGRESDSMVCCGSTSNFLAPMINKTVDKDKLLADRTYCGYQHSDDYFRNETTIGINEFPWLAGLVYKKDNETTIRCSGTLINNRYVLTAAYCIFIEYTRLVGVRLGEYNIRTDEDCTQDSSFYECSDPPENIGIEKTISHPQYNHGERYHNIGLLRLSKKVQYSDYIRPICLPTAGTMFAKPGDTLLTSGWGISFSSRSEEKKKKNYNILMSHEECVAAMKGYYEINKNYFCAKGLENNTEFDCETAFGAPAMYSFRSQWHQEGILSLYWTCDSSFPILNIKVVNYLDWIKENIEP